MTNEGKIYSISLKGSSSGYAMTHLHADQFHGVHCLKGIARSTKDHAGIEGRRIYIPVIEIASITEFESWADYTKASKLADDADAPPAPKKSKKRSKSKKRR